MQELEGGKMEVEIVVNAVLTYKIIQNVSTHIGQLTPAYNSSSRGSHTLFWPLGAPGLMCAYPHTTTQLIKIKLKFFKIKTRIIIFLILKI